MKAFSQVSLVDYTCKETATREQRFVSKDKKNKTVLNHPSTKSFDQEKLGTEGDAEIYRDHVNFNSGRVTNR